MTLKEQLQKDLIESMKSHDEVRTGAIRMIKAAVLKFEVSGEKKVATDEEVLTIIAKEVKQRKDSIEQFKAGGREDLAKVEEGELAILEKYLPAQMSEEEVLAIAKEVVAATGASSKADIGKVMGALMPKVKGKADGQIVNKVVSSLLA